MTKSIKAEEFDRIFDEGERTLSITWTFPPFVVPTSTPTCGA